MSRQLSEKQVLEMLGIPDFRHLSKDRIMSFTSALPQMEPQVAIAALQQVPHFADTSLEIMRIYKETVSQTLAEDQENVQSFNASCDMVLGLLETLSQNDDLSFEQKNELIDRMMAVLKMKSDKDTETKRFKFAVIGAVPTIIAMAKGAKHMVTTAKMRSAYAPVSAPAAAS